MALYGNIWLNMAYMAKCGSIWLQLSMGGLDGSIWPYLGLKVFFGVVYYSSWVMYGLYGSKRHYTGMHGLHGLHGSIWLYIAIYRLIWLDMDIFWYVCMYVCILAPNGVICIYMDCMAPYGSI